MNRPDLLKLHILSKTRFVKCIFVCALLTAAACSRSSHSGDRIRLTDSPRTTTAPPPSPTLQDCPGPTATQLGDRHKVVLNWNASSSSTGPNDKAVGYCLYRSDSPIKADRFEDCKVCGKITPVPIIGTICMDNFGDGGKTYYYAAIAIDSGGHKSKFSNKTTGRLTPKKSGAPSSNKQNPPSCRVPDVSN